MSTNVQKVFFGFSVFFLCSSILYLGIFGRALRQHDDHVGIFFALPRVILGNGISQVNDTTYLASNSNAFRDEMKYQGFQFVDQMGSGYFFEREGKKYLSSGRMYSSHFMVFSVPEENER